MLRATRRLPAAAIVLTAVLVILEVSWAWHRTPQLFEWEPNKRQATRAQAEDFLAATSRPDDLLFGYEPLFLGAWERNNSFPDVVLPRADAVLALQDARAATEAARPRRVDPRRQRAEQPQAAPRDGEPRPRPARAFETASTGRSSSSARASR